MKQKMPSTSPYMVDWGRFINYLNTIILINELSAVQILQI